MQVRGVGGDAYWPPTQPRGWSAASIKGAVDKVIHPKCTQSFAQKGLYGGPQAAHSWGDWIAKYQQLVHPYTHLFVASSRSKLRKMTQPDYRSSTVE